MSTVRFRGMSEKIRHFFIFNRSVSRCFWIVGVLLFLQALALGFAAWSHRPLAFDGGWWFYNLMFKDQFFHNFHQPFHRYSDGLWRLPSQIIFYLSDSDLLLKMGLRLGEFLSQFHPLLSLGWSFWFLGQKERIDLIYFPILGFVVGSLPVLAFAANVATTAVTFAWPMALIILLGNWKKKTTMYFYCLLAIVYAFSYPSGFILWPLFLFFLIEKGKFDRGFFLRTAIHASIFAAILQAFLFAKEVNYEWNWGTQFAWRLSEIPVAYFNFLALLLLAAILLEPVFSKIRGKSFLFISFIGLLLFFLAMFGLLLNLFQSSEGLKGAFNYRLVALPMTALILILFNIQIKKGALNSKFEKAKWFFLISLQLVSLIVDIHYTNEWNRGRFEIERIVGDRSGCFFQSRDSFNVDINTLVPWSTGFSSIAWQMSHRPRYVFFIEDLTGPMGAGDKCQEFFGGQRPETRLTTKIINKTWKVNWELVRGEKQF